MIDRSCPARASHHQNGFTLLEVMVALTITAMVLGSLFALATGSKQLAFRSNQSLTTAIEARAAVNFAFLQNEYGDVEAAIDNDRLTIRGEDYLDPVERKTQPNTLKLQHFEVIDEETDERIEGVRWIKLELPE
ncbi:MAG: prepilin-type N-terminal cleavage/methylation domain-containing protein [Pseudomonadales bacterium]|nr:prepilin-type N-terminal cleavage/methylation domain-containing protein [Pseudomonadales bacterium]